MSPRIFLQICPSMRQALDVHCMRCQTHLSLPKLGRTNTFARLSMLDQDFTPRRFLDAADPAARLSITVPVLSRSTCCIVQRGKWDRHACRSGDRRRLWITRNDFF
jgi:hypothetical protein